MLRRAIDRANDKGVSKDGLARGGLQHLMGERRFNLRPRRSKYKSRPALEPGRIRRT